MLTIGLLFTQLLVLSACQSACRSKPLAWKDLIKEPSSEAAPPPPPVATSNHLIVYLDTSGSMAGYVSSDQQGQTIFSRTLQELRNFISTISPPIDVAVRRVDSTISNVYPDSYLSEASVNRGAFTGKETDLAGAISLFEKGVEAGKGQADSKGKGGEGGKEKEESSDDPLPPARFHVLVTDGVQSRTQQSADSSCLAGSDQTCVRKRILALLSKGWGGYVIGVRSEFQGNIFSEVTRGKTVAYETKKRAPEGFRPFYIYVFSPDRAALDKLVGILTERLRPLLAREDGLRTLALTSAYSNGETQAELIVPKESAKLLGSSKSERHANPPGFTLRVDVGTDRLGPAKFQIKTNIPWATNVRDEGTAVELAEMVNWSLVPLDVAANQAGNARFPEIKIIGQEIAPDGSITLQATAQYPGGVTGKPQWRYYVVEGNLKLEQQTPPWVRQWSSNLDTSVEYANKTLYLESTLLGLWNNPDLKKQTIAKIYLRVGP
jgi:hypothetical protein